MKEHAHCYIIFRGKVYYLRMRTYKIDKQFQSKYICIYKNNQNQFCIIIKQKIRMSKQVPIAKNNEFLYLNNKMGKIFQQCFNRCTKKNDYSSLNNKQVTCIQACSSKLCNAYSFMYNVSIDKGVSRTPQYELKQKAI